MRIWDLRAPRVPAREVRLGGGVYGLARDGDGAFLASCMGAGVARVATDAAGGLVCEGVYAHHGSLAYGAARSATTGVVASCSFYDRALHLWRTGAAA